MTTQLWLRPPGAETSPPGAERADGPSPADESTGMRAGSPRAWVRRRVILALGLALAVAAVTLLLVAQGPAPVSSAPLDPANPTPGGAQALARVLESQGVRVDVARGQAELSGAGVDAATTVFVARTGDLAPVTTRRLAETTRGAQRLVVLGADRTVVRSLSPDVTVTDTRRAERDLVASPCGTADVRPGDTLSRSEEEYQSRAGAPGCFTRDGRSVYLALPGGATTAPLVLLGSSSIVANDEVTAASNAAVLLRMLGHSGRVVWYVPARDDIPTGATGPAALVPRWLGPVTALGAVAFAGLVLWRGRRFGRLVTEPLPVVVRAVETTESRGRLYHRAREASRAALVLQQATRTRLADYLGLPLPAPSHTSPDAAHALVTAVADATGRPVEQVGALLFGPPPSREDHLPALATELAALEKEVCRA